MAVAWLTDAVLRVDSTTSHTDTEKRELLCFLYLEVVG